MKKLFLMFFLALCIIGVKISYAEQILITFRSDGDETIFDGKWTFLQEWKSTSENVLEFDDGSKLSVKTGHDRNNLYVLLDFISDHTFSKSADFGIVCIDSKSDKEDKPESDDYCFFITLGSKNPITLQGGSILANSNYLMKIENNPRLVAVGGISDENDRYSVIPHTTYEFKIPVEVFGSSDIYGFYVAVYDANTNLVYTWPQNISIEKFPYIPSQSKWGELISPDKSLPEFQLPILALLPALFIVLYLTRTKQISFNKEK
jgi:hypothetical protein